MKYTFDEAITKPIWSRSKELRAVKRFLTEIHNMFDMHLYMEWIEYYPIDNMNRPFDRLGLKVDLLSDEGDIVDKMHISDIFGNLIDELFDVEYSVTISALGRKMEFASSGQFQNVESYWTVLFAGNNPNAFRDVRVNEMVLEVDIDTNSKKKQPILNNIPEEILDNESNLLDLCGYTENLGWV